MNYKIEKLKDVADIIRGVSFSKDEATTSEKENTLPIIRAGSIQKELLINYDNLWIAQDKVKLHQIIKKDDIIMCTSSGSADLVGKTARATTDWKGSFGAFCTGIRPKIGKCNASFLFHFLQSPTFRNWTQLSSGANIKNIRVSELGDFKIQFPDLPTQTKIAQILDKADQIRQKRKKAIELADEFLRSLFLEMFGDPVVNPKGWEVYPLGKLVENLDNERIPLKSEDRLARQGCYPYYGASGIIDSIDDYLFEGKYLLISEDGANLLTRSAPISFIVEGKFWVNNHAHILGKKELSLNYLMFSLNLRTLEPYITGSAQPKLNQQKLNQIPITIPDKSLLGKFDNIVELVNQKKQKLIASGQFSDELFNSLSQQYFAKVE